MSCTITFDPETEGQHLSHALDYFQYQLKGVSFLPRVDYGAFPQVRRRVTCKVSLRPAIPCCTAPRRLYSTHYPSTPLFPRSHPLFLFSKMPYEAISEQQYEERAAELQKLDFTRRQSHSQGGMGARGVRIEEVPDKFCETDACTTTVSYGVSIGTPGDGLKRGRQRAQQRWLLFLQGFKVDVGRVGYRVACVEVPLVVLCETLSVLK